MRVLHREKVFEDERGEITDILEKEFIDSITLISSKKGAVRGNHYHKESIQYMYVLKGSLKLFTQSPGWAVETAVLKAGDLVYTPAMERHALVALEDAEFLTLSRGTRGGSAYEQDTYRLEKPLVSEQESEQTQLSLEEGSDLES
jgi:quercetin dioxygenase-like cupin family protein